MIVNNYNMQLNLKHRALRRDIEGVASLGNCCCFCLFIVVNGSLLGSPFARQEMQGFIESYINRTFRK